MPRFGRSPTGVDPYTPNGARVFNYLLVGKGNFDVDGLVADRMLAVTPDTTTVAWFGRQFLIKSTRPAAEAGVRQSGTY